VKSWRIYYDGFPIKNKEDTDMSLGETIRECRKKAGLSQEQLAEKLNVSRQLQSGKQIKVFPMLPI